MPALWHEAIDDGTWCIDTGLYRPHHTACYLVHDHGELAIIDCGSSNNIPDLVDTLTALGFSAGQVRYVLPTHVHLDHAGGAGALIAACPEATLVTHERGAPHMIDPARLQAGATAVYGEEGFAQQFGNLVPVPADRVSAAADGDRLPLGTRQLRFADTPGHANHHGCFLDETTRLWFTGDTFGLSYREFDAANGPLMLATTTPVAFDPDAWERSLDKLLDADPAGMCLTHFGRVDDVRVCAERLRRSIRDHASIALDDEDQPEEGRAKRLRQGVADLLLRVAQAQQPAVSREQAARLLALDIDLNAQGLQVWLKRRAKRAASP